MLISITFISKFWFVWAPVSVGSTQLLWCVSFGLRRLQVAYRWRNCTISNVPCAWRAESLFSFHAQNAVYFLLSIAGGSCDEWNMYSTCGTTPKGSNTGDIWPRFFSALLLLLFAGLANGSSRAASVWSKKTTHIRIWIYLLYYQRLSCQLCLRLCIASVTGSGLSTYAHRNSRDVLCSAALICF